MLAWARNAELSARVIALTVVLECFEAGDDPFEVGLDAAQVLGEPELAVGVGLGDQAAVGWGLPSVDLQELRGGLEVWAGQAGVRVRAVLLGRAAAVDVRQAVADAVEVVLDSFGRSGRRVGAVADRLTADVDLLGLVAVECLPDGGVVDLGVVAGHVRAGMAEEPLRHVLRDAGIDQPLLSVRRGAGWGVGRLRAAGRRFFGVGPVPGLCFSWTIGAREKHLCIANARGADYCPSNDWRGHAWTSAIWHPRYVRYAPVRIRQRR